MAERIPNEIYEELLVRLDVKSLLRCKSVCKSWKSLISCPRFIKAHWKRSYNNNDNGLREFNLAVFPYYLLKDDIKYNIVGSAHGLVCINTGDEIIVANPWTREEKTFKMPHVTEFSCWGFGYDSLTDDYKVVLGIRDDEKDQTSFQVLSLKSNVWKHIGHVNYRCSISQRVGTLCNEALHWVMYHLNSLVNSWIISLDLSKEVFKEIPQPDDARYEPDNVCWWKTMVGIKNECLCIYRMLSPLNNNLWVMKKYNVKQSWVTLGRNYQLKFEDHAIPYERSTHKTWYLQKCASLSTNVMQSIISPNLQACNE